jgi:hypothetical protein
MAQPLASACCGRLARPWRRAGVRAWVVAVLGTLTAGAASAPDAAADRSFTARFSATDRGQIVTAGNTVITCPGTSTSCRSAQSGTSSATNQDFTMGYVDVDSDSTSFNSSRATLALPSGSTVLFAGLYWGGDTSAGSNGSAAPYPSFRSYVHFDTPTAANRVVQADTLDTDATSSTRYQGFADVTSSVASGGNGVYTVGNIETGTGGNRFGGWGLVVVYRSAAEPIRRLTVYDGLLTLQSGLRPTADIPLSGFVTPPSGTVSGRLSLLAWEGDRGLTGDSATLAGRSISDTANPVQNVMNSSATRAGTAVTGRTPSHANLMGVDIDDITVDGFLGNNVTSATLRLATANDLYMPGAIGLAFEEGPPLSSTAPSVSGTARDGQTLTADAGVCRAPGRSRTPTSGAAATRAAPTAPTSRARRRRPTRSGPRTSARRCGSSSPPRTPRVRPPRRRRPARGSRRSGRRTPRRPPSPAPRATASC